MTTIFLLLYNIQLHMVAYVYHVLFYENVGHQMATMLIRQYCADIFLDHCYHDLVIISL